MAGWSVAGAGDETIGVEAACPAGSIAVGGSCDGGDGNIALEWLDNGTCVFRDNRSAGGPARTLVATAHCIQ